MKNTIFYRVFILGCIFSYILLGCSKMDATYAGFIEDGEKVYSANPDTIWVASGENRLRLSWIMSSAPNVVRYVVYWNNELDSISGPIGEVMNDDTANVIIDELEEGVYTFEIYTFDKAGNRSVGKIVSGHVYGAEYISTLSNRALKRMTLVGENLELEWFPADSTNVSTEITFTNLSDRKETIYLSPDSTNIILKDVDLSKYIYYRSTYKPRKNALDTFTVNFLDSVQVNNVPVSKELWKAVRLPYDAGYRSDDPENYGLYWLWDGQPADYPEIFYSSDKYFPLAFTIDLGRTYNQLTRIEEWGRSAGYYNPLNFEVWGIADTSNALIPVPPDDPNWKSKSLANGWTLLGVVNRDPDDPDEGASGWTKELIADPPAIRFIRIRVLKTYGNKTKTHLSELSFWYNMVSPKIRTGS